MTTKEQERKALEQIRKIVASLGEDSYVATAFEGCFEIAEQNIDNDWACSMKDRAESAVKAMLKQHDKIADLKAQIKGLQEENSKIKSELELAKTTIKQEAERANRAQGETLNERKDVLVETVDDRRDHCPFAKVQFYNNDGFKFINVVQKSGWTTSYKIDDLKTLVIE